MTIKHKNTCTLTQPIARKDGEISEVESTGAISQAGSLRG
ncbi:phage tail assembly protein, partial [Klebsiella pneumoniae]|nr:phage tail assembly protein [Klebsiella pneumoniae]